MADFVFELPKDILKDIERLNKNADKIFGGMTKAGADVVLENVKANVPASWRSSEIMRCIKTTKTYRTPSDDGIATKVIISGYFKNKNGVKTPAPLVANVFEYGSSKFTKKPFLRKSFQKSQIEKAMLKAQKELSGGLLDE
jgi:hypothetical protein